MVKVNYAKNSPARPRRGKGMPVVVEDPRGTFVRSAPRFSSDKKEYWRWWMRQEFSIAARWASTPEPLAYLTAVEMAKNTEFIPRDIIMMASMGTYYEIIMPDGTRMEPGRMATSNVQYILDLLDPQVGSVIARTSNGWWALDPGAQGQVLTMDGAWPGWRDAQGGGGGGSKASTMLDLFSTSNPSTGSHGAYGNIFKPWVDISVSAAQAKMTTVTGAVYKLGIAPFDRGTLKMTALPSYTADVAVSAIGAGQYLNGSFVPSITLTAGQDYILLMVRTDAGPTPTQTMQYISSQRTAWGYQFPATATVYWSNTDDPDTASSWSADGGGNWSLAPVTSPA